VKLYSNRGASSRGNFLQGLACCTYGSGHLRRLLEMHQPALRYMLMGSTDLICLCVVCTAWNPRGLSTCGTALCSCGRRICTG
jgi:hypothetical protein